MTSLISLSKQFSPIKLIHRHQYMYIQLPFSRIKLPQHQKCPPPATPTYPHLLQNHILPPYLYPRWPPPIPVPCDSPPLSDTACHGRRRNLHTRTAIKIPRHCSASNARPRTAHCIAADHPRIDRIACTLKLHFTHTPNHTLPRREEKLLSNPTQW